jgi:hypothetical protein
MRCCWNNKDALWHAAFSLFSFFFYVWVHLSHRGGKGSSDVVASVDGGERWDLCAVCEVDDVMSSVVSFCFDRSRAIWSGTCMIVNVTCIVPRKWHSVSPVVLDECTFQKGLKVLYL